VVVILDWLGAIVDIADSSRFRRWPGPTMLLPSAEANLGLPFRASHGRSIRYFGVSELGHG
jgi:hypothetical protein